MLTFVGLGLYDERSITLKGRETIAAADRVFAEWYTSRLTGTDVETLARYHEAEIETLDREGVEGDPGPMLDAARRGHVAFLTGGDPMISTTHVDLRLRAADRGIETRIVHAPSVATAASGLTGLQNYRFGKSTTIPFPREGADPLPPSVVETIRANTDRDLHTLVYLDLDGPERASLHGDEAAGILADVWPDRLGVVVARAGSDAPLVRANTLQALSSDTFGPPLHVLVIPGALHPMEAATLETFADAPPELLPST